MLPKIFLCGLGQAASVSLHSHTENAEQQQQQQLSITGVFRDVRLDVAREVLMWGTQLPSAGRDSLRTLPKLKNRGTPRGGKPGKYSGKKVLTGSLWCHLEKASP